MKSRIYSQNEASIIWVIVTRQSNEGILNLFNAFSFLRKKDKFAKCFAFITYYTLLSIVYVHEPWICWKLEYIWIWSLSVTFFSWSVMTMPCIEGLYWVRISVQFKLFRIFLIHLPVLARTENIWTFALLYFS